jgi:hypothetical protein
LFQTVELNQLFSTSGKRNIGAWRFHCAKRNEHAVDEFHWSQELVRLPLALATGAAGRLLQ